MKKTLLVGLFWLGYILTGYSQVGTLGEVQQPIKPDAAALGKYVEMPVGYYSGIPEISIPLYELKTKNLGVPISLSYHASGIKRREIPGWVGAGFSLNAGGVITRIVRGLSDGNDLANPNDYKRYADSLGQPGYSTFIDYRTLQGIESEYTSLKTDTEFDEFYFNFMGHTGSFTFTNEGKPMMKTINQMKCAYADQHFKLTDANGVVYAFEETETAANAPDSPQIISWYLTKITAPVTNETIEFKYTDAGTSKPYIRDYAPVSYFSRRLYEDKSPTYPPGIKNPACEVNGNGTLPLQQLNDGSMPLFVQQVIYKTDTVKFYKSNNVRSDIYKIQLDSIRVSSGHELLHRIRFSYTYSDTLTTDSLAKKLLLSAVKSDDQPACQLSYFNDYMGKKMPGIYVPAEDSWGYYNGEASPATDIGTRLMPRFKVLTGGNSSFKNPDYRYALIGTLKSMSYPTGGRTEFDYEGNDFAYSNQADLYLETAADVVMALDSVRQPGIRVIGPLTAFSYDPIVLGNDIIIHQDQTVTINSSIGLSTEMNSLLKYTSYLYNEGEGYEGKVRLLKYNTTTGAFDLVEERAFNPVSVMGLPGSDPAFFSVRPSGTSSEQHTRFLTEGWYRVESEVLPGGMMASISVNNKFRYKTQPHVYNAGGLRIKKIRFISPVNSSSFEKSYDYSYKGMSSGVLESPFANASGVLHWGERRFVPEGHCIDGYIGGQICSSYILNYDNVVPLGNSKGGVIGYAQVTERMNDGRKKVMQFTNGYVDNEHADPLFDGYQDGYTNYGLGSVPIINHKTADYSDLRGIMKRAEYYNSSSQKIKTEVHLVRNIMGMDVNGYDPGQPHSRSTFVVLGNIILNGDRCSETYESHLGAGLGDILTIPVNVVPLIDSTYYFNGADTLKEVTKYVYNTVTSANASTITRMSSRGDSSITHYKYPYDYTITGSSSIAFSKGIKLLQDRNVISQPVEAYTQEKKGSGSMKVTSAQLVSYRPDIPAPDTVYSLSNQNGLTNFSPASFTVSTATKDSRYERSLLFTRYDSYGNVVEQHQKKEVNEVLIWGYQKRYIVARVLGSDYNTVIALVDTAVINNPSSDSALRTELQKIRTALASSSPKSKVTTYTFSALKGMTSMTDSKGETVYYEYDSFGRLKISKDPDAQLKENLRYHYKP